EDALHHARTQDDGDAGTAEQERHPPRLIPVNRVGVIKDARNDVQMVADGADDCAEHHDHEPRDHYRAGWPPRPLTWSRTTCVSFGFSLAVSSRYLLNSTIASALRFCSSKSRPRS